MLREAWISSQKSLGTVGKLCKWEKQMDLHHHRNNKIKLSVHTWSKQTHRNSPAQQNVSCEHTSHRLCSLLGATWLWFSSNCKKTQPLAEAFWRLCSHCVTQPWSLCVIRKPLLGVFLDFNLWNTMYLSDKKQQCLETWERVWLWEEKINGLVLLMAISLRLSWENQETMSNMGPAIYWNHLTLFKRGIFELKVKFYFRLWWVKGSGTFTFHKLTVDFYTLTLKCCKKSSMTSMVTTGNQIDLGLPVFSVCLFVFLICFPCMVLLLCSFINIDKSNMKR